MTYILVDGANPVWLSKVRTLIANLARKTGESLHAEACTPGNTAESASFELRPMHSYAHNSYIECRFADPHREDRVHSFVRIQIQFKDEYRGKAIELQKWVTAKISDDFNAEISDSSQTIYVTKRGLPSVDIGSPLPLLMRESPGVLHAYVDSALTLQRLWQSIESDVRALSRTWRPVR
jgi:hypothetical protein